MDLTFEELRDFRNKVGIEILASLNLLIDAQHTPEQIYGLFFEEIKTLYRKGMDNDG